MVTDEKKEIKSCLKSETWTLKRGTNNSWMAGNNIISHLNRSDGDASKTLFCVPLDPRTGKPKEIFSAEEKAFLEEALGLKTGSLNAGSEYMLEKTVELKGQDRTFNLADPVDYIDLAIVRANDKLITIDGKFKQGAEYSLTCENEKVERQINIRNLRAKAAALILELTVEEKKNILLLYGYSTVGMNDLSVEDKFGAVAEQDPERILKIRNLPNFKAQVFIRKGIEKKVLHMIGSNIFYNETLLGIGVEGAATFIHDPKNKQLLSVLKENIL